MKFKYRIITVLMLIIAMITLVSSSSQAFSGFDSNSVGKVVTGGYNDLMQPNNYCIQYNAPLYNGPYSFKVENYIKIEGTTLYINGNKINSKKENAILAYIIGANYDNNTYNYSYSGENYTLRQKLLWAYWNEWSSSAGRSWNYEGNNYWSEYKNNKEMKEVMKDAQDYANNVGSGIKADVQITNKTVESQGTYDGGEKIGTFSIIYTGNIKSFTIEDTSGKEITSGITFYQDGKEVSKTNIQSGKDFYIINKSGRQAKNINIKVTAKSQEIYNVELWRLNNINGGQNMIYAKHSKKTDSDEKTLNIDIKRQDEGTLKIHKQDTSTKVALTGAGFKINTGTDAKNLGSHWLGVNETTGEYIYDTTYDKAKEFFVDDKGDLEIKNLKVGTSITVYETTAPKGYELAKQSGYDTSNIEANRVRCNFELLKVSKKDEVVKVDIGNSKNGNIEITKQDTTTKEKLTGAGFKVSVKEAGNKDKNIWLKQNNDETYSYTSSFKDATEFKVTDANNGIYQIKGLEPQNYYIYEVTAPKGYNITTQEKYDSKNEWVVCGSVDVESGNVAKVTIDNTKTINLEGYVWIEKPGSKANEYNDLFDEAEEKITDKVIITLRNKSDNSEIAKATIDNSKKIYRFENIDYNKLKDYYVNFNYKDTDYRNYITVDAKFDVANGSKVLAQNVPDYDKDLTGEATTYKGTNAEAKYGLSYLATKFYNESTNTVENVNLGIKELPATPFTVSENLAYVDMKIKGYNYRYIYGGTGAKVQTVPTIQWQSKTDKESYTRDIYPSDVLYENPSDKTQELQVYATYRIDVTNNTKIDVQYLYQERYLNVTKVLNKYDTARYELADTNWEVSGEDATIVKMKDEYLQKQYYDANKNGISNENDKNNKYAYITFKIKKEALTEMLKSKFGTIEEFPTEATVTAYHTYTRIDASWKNNLTKTQTHYTRESTQSDKAPYLNTRPGENRIISGKVFEDKNTRNNGELVGNGMYDQNENKVQGVTVELGNYNDDGTFVVTDLYVKNEDGTTRFGTDGKLPKATMKTTEKEGKYSFEGVVPGEYFLRYTYGDGTQEIVSANGNKKVSSNEYKSTIVTEEIKKAYETDYEATKATWYLGMGENHNIAVDDLKQREELSKNKLVLDITNSSNEEAKNITAETPEFSVPIEFTDKTEGVATEQYPAELGYMDFGIIQIPNTRIGIDKKITNIKLTYQNGQVAIDGNPATQNLAYTTDLDKVTNGGSKYVKVELDSEYIYGGTLEIKYEIEISNDSDLDYIEKEGSKTYGYYYKYGIITEDAHEKTLKIEDAIDYLDPKLSYKSKEGELDLKEIDVKEFRNKDSQTLSNEEKRILTLVKAQESISGKEFDKILQITGMGELNSSKGNNKDKSSKKIIIDAQKILSSQEDDLEFINVAEVTRIEIEPMTPANVDFVIAGTTVTQENNFKIGQTPNVTLTITPSTGADRSLVYLVAGITALAIIAGGIVIIKKKVL